MNALPWFGRLDEMLGVCLWIALVFLGVANLLYRGANELFRAAKVSKDYREFRKFIAFHDEQEAAREGKEPHAHR